ncbi:hypothetical protein A3J41_00790 [candidate division TM6 bacterium RIFCSPHIGHO2_12_FULL_38_8]|nr:MAG: hypothetical protein A3J41_00790 [candidate division TM6 bacterium RIFCSPHIGHO2_12_FULL_38_8]
MFLMFKVGVVSGMIMGIAAMILHKIKFTTLDLTRYFGALLTGKASGTVNFISGFIFHLIVSGILGFVYAFAMIRLQISISVVNAVLFGLVHTLISGSFLPFFDKLNPCVAQGLIRPMGYFASKYGVTAVITFVAGHVIYALCIFYIRF